MEKIYARLIVKGIKTIDDVPDSIREAVKSYVKKLMEKGED